MAKNPKQTSPGVASKAGRLLPKKKTSQTQKSIDASALSQAPYKKTPGK